MRTSSMIGRISVLALALASWSTVAAQSSPEQIVAAFFGPNGIPDKAGVYAGEMTEFKDRPTVGQFMPAGVQVVTRPLAQAGGLSVFSVNRSRNGATQDWYAYLAEDEGRWTLRAVRSLALTAIPAMLLQQLEQKPSRTTDEEWTLQNLKLMFKSDLELKNYVTQHLAQLEGIAGLAESSDADGALTAGKRLFIRSVSKKDGRIELTVGGVTDNLVGFAFVPTGVSPPPITPDDYIYVERVTDHWYVFKTT